MPVPFDVVSLEQGVPFLVAAWPTTGVVLGLWQRALVRPPPAVPWLLFAAASTVFVSSRQQSLALIFVLTLVVAFHCC